MSDHNPGAFPCAPYPPFQGMTLRDWFAGQFLAGMGSWAPPRPDGTFVEWEEGPEYEQKIVRARAAYAYAQADAMLAEREVRS